MVSYVLETADKIKTCWPQGFSKSQQNPVDHATGNEPLNKPEVKGNEMLTCEIYECDALVCVP